MVYVRDDKRNFKFQVNLKFNNQNSATTFLLNAHNTYVGGVKIEPDYVNLIFNF